MPLITLLIPLKKEAKPANPEISWVTKEIAVQHHRTYWFRTEDDDLEGPYDTLREAQEAQQEYIKVMGL